MEKSSGLISLEVVAQINQIPVDIRAVVREYGITEARVSPEVIVRIARSQGFKSRIKHKLSITQLAEKYPQPAIAIMPDGDYIVLLKSNLAEGKVLCYLPQEGKTDEWLISALPTSWIIMSPRMFNAQTRFGLEWFMQEVMNYKRVILEVLLGSCLVQMFGLVTPLLTQVILDKVIVHHSTSTLDVLGVAFLGITVFELLLNLTRNYIFTHTANKIDAKLGAKLFRHLFALPFPFFESRKVGIIISRLRELESVREFITNKSVSVIIDLMFSFIFVGVMFIYSAPLTFIVLGFVAFIAIVYLLITPIFRERLQNKFMMAAQSSAYLVESVTGVQTVKSLAIEGMMQKRWEDNLGSYLGASFRLTNMSNVASAFATVFQRLMTIAILYFGVKLVIENQMSIGQLIAFNMLSGQFTAPVLRLVNLWNELQQALLGIDRLGDILNHPTEVVDEKSSITLSELKGEIKIENLSFKYAPGAPMVLNDVSLDIPSNRMIGIVGRSGSGKSTITKLIQRLYFASAGAIYLDGIDIRHLNPHWLRYQIGVVLQDNYLFSGTIRDNIALPQPNASMEQVIRVSEIAGAHDFIAKLPEGYDTPVGERGSTLSGGQRQRIAIARALITGPRILILDEATSALDYESERIINKNLQLIRQGRTVIIIAHRLSTVRKCDLIVAMDNGKIVEIGTHDQLMANRNYYYALATEADSEEVS